MTALHNIFESIVGYGEKVGGTPPANSYFRLRVELIRVELLVFVCQFVDFGLEFVFGLSRLPFSLRGRPRRRMCGLSCDLVATLC